MLLTIGSCPRISHRVVSPASGHLVRLWEPQVALDSPPPLSSLKNPCFSDLASTGGIVRNSSSTSSISKVQDDLSPEPVEISEPPDPCPVEASVITKFSYSPGLSGVSTVFSRGSYERKDLNPKPVRTKFVMACASLLEWLEQKSVTRSLSPPWPDPLYTAEKQTEPPEPPDPPDWLLILSVAKRISVILEICEFKSWSQRLVFDRNLFYMLMMFVLDRVIITSVRFPSMFKLLRPQLSYLELSVKMTCTLLLFDTISMIGNLVLKSAFGLNRNCLYGSSSRGVKPKSLGFWCVKHKRKSNPLVVTVAETDDDLAIKTALSQTEDIKFRSVKSDALQWIKAAISSSSALKPHGRLHEESIYFKFSPRMANDVVNVVAKSTLYELVKHNH